jgi:hypothetical protein
VIFETFGDNALGLLLRCFVDSIDLRVSTISALNEAINDKFNAAGISIAFPQRDLHLDTIKPLQPFDWTRSRSGSRLRAGPAPIRFQPPVMRVAPGHWRSRRSTPTDPRRSGFPSAPASTAAAASPEPARDSPASGKTSSLGLSGQRWRFVVLEPAIFLVAFLARLGVQERAARGKLGVYLGRTTGPRLRAVVECDPL